MKFPLKAAAAILFAVSLQACEQQVEAPAVPFSLTEEAMGRYCGMNVLEHPGPKGQVILSRYDEPIWFSSARDAIAFTLLPEEPKDIRAVFVSDMARAASWDDPGADNWVEAARAFFVIGSSRKGGMGADEVVPFSSREAAQAFQEEHGGRIVTLAQVPSGYILGGAEADTAALHDAIVFKKLERDADGKPFHTSPHPALGEM